MTESSLRALLLSIILTLVSLSSLLSVTLDMYEIMTGRMVVFLGDTSHRIWQSSTSEGASTYISLDFFLLDLTVKVVPVFLVIILYLFASDIIRRSKNLVELEKYYPELDERIKQLSTEAGLQRAPKTFLSKKSKPECYTFGRSNDPYLVVSEGMIEILETLELDSVFTHEIGHILNRDVGIVALCSIYLYAYKYYAALLIIYEIYYMIFLANLWTSHDTMLRAASRCLPQLFTLVPTFFVPLLLVNSLSRTREYLADGISLNIVGDPKPLVSALEKIEADEYFYRPSGYISRLTIMSPQKGHSNRFVSFISRLFLGTHPPREDRRKNLGIVNMKPEIPSFEVLFWYAITISYAVMAATELGILLFSYFSDSWPMEIPSISIGPVKVNYYLLFEVFVPAVILPLPVINHMKRLDRTVSIKIWKRTMFILFTYSSGFSIYVLANTLGKNVFGYGFPDFLRFSQLKNEYIRWIFYPYIYYLFPRTHYFLFTNTAIYLTDVLDIIGCVFIGLFIFCTMNTVLFIVLGMKRVFPNSRLSSRPIHTS